ncbi:Crp/Fnr family transcriptional regulator [Variovorax sp. GB1R11]|uniref:Crp/Fnr family transcriptional regulator n=1 Tax=Variovorax sp. GB1R11 TaxID=3443741 RepID=UPI003F47499D
MPSNENHLIQLLPARDRERLVAACEPVQLDLAEVLCEPGALTRHVYFPTEGFISLVAKVEGSMGVEVGMIGREGMLGAQLSLDVPTAPLHALVQGPGVALRVGTDAFAHEMELSPALRRLLKRYVYVLMIQLAHSAACQRFHVVNARLARWLLMSEDRAQAETFHVTQEFLAYMLGVRRVGVTNAASALQRDGLIEYHRGEVHVLNRSGLAKAACSCYDADRRAYAELLGQPSGA